MNICAPGSSKFAAFAVAGLLLGSGQALAQDAYITNTGSNTVSVISLSTNKVIATIPVGKSPYGVAVTSDGSKVYVANQGDKTVSVISTATRKVIGSQIPVGLFPKGVAVSPDGSKVYVAESSEVAVAESGTVQLSAVSVIASATNKVIGTIRVCCGGPPQTSIVTGVTGIAVSPDGSKVYVAGFKSIDNATGAFVWVIATATNKVITKIASGAWGVAVTPDGSKVYVAEIGSNGVAVISTATNKVITRIIFVGVFPFGVAVTPDGSKVYVTNQGQPSNGFGATVAVISTATNKIIAMIPIGVSAIGAGAYGVAVTPDGSKVYVADRGSNTVSVISTATNKVIGSPIPVGSSPSALGVFIRPATRRLPGTRGQ